MSVFLSLFMRLLPLYMTMGAGAVLTRRTSDLAAGLAVLQIYLIAPVVIFSNILKLSITPGLFLYPVVWFLFVATISSTVHFFAKKKGSSYAPILAQASGGSNTGYLGAPVAMLLFPAEWMPVYFFVMVGGLFYESTLGYYWIARGAFSVREAVGKILRLPTFYALLLGLAGNAWGLSIPDAWENTIRDFMGAYVVLGALIIGLALGRQKKFVLAPSFAGVLLAIKFLVWPAAMFGIVILLRFVIPDVPVAVARSLLLMSIMPLAANSAAFAALFKLHAEETATVVALSTLLSLAIVPFYVVLFGLAG